MKKIISITVHEITDYDLFNLKSKCHNYSELENKYILPEYIVNPNNNELTTSYYYLQFTGDIKEDCTGESWLIFNFNNANDLLDHEISECGFKTLMNEFKIDFSTLLPNLTINNFDDSFIPIESNIVFDMNYIGDKYEADLELKLIGYFNGDLEYVELNK